MAVFLGEIIAEHDLVAPGETAICRRPLRRAAALARPERCGPRPPRRRPSVALGPAAEDFIKGAAAQGIDHAGGRPRRAVRHGGGPRHETPSSPPLERAVEFGRFRAHDVRSILAAGTGVSRARRPVTRSSSTCPLSPSRSLGDYAIGERVMSTTPPPSPADLEAGLRRLRLGAMRRLSPELLMVAKTQRWKPEEFLRTLVEAEIASRDASNARARMAAAAFPVTKTLDEFDVDASSVTRATFDYLASLEWIAAKENLCLVGPAGTGKSHLLVALGHHAVDAGKRVRYFTATDLVETLYRGLADNSVGRVIEQILKADLILIDEIGFAPMDDNGAQLFFRVVAAAYERRSLGIGSHWPFEDWGRFLPEHTTAVSLLDRLLHHSVLVATSGESFRLKEARRREVAQAHRNRKSPRGVRTSGGQNCGVETGHGQSKRCSSASSCHLSLGCRFRATSAKRFSGCLRPMPKKPRSTET